MRGNNVRGGGARGGIPQVRDAHVAGQVGDPLPVSEDLGGHAVSLALVHPPALRYRDARGILSSLHQGKTSVPGSCVPRSRGWSLYLRAGGSRAPHAGRRPPCRPSCLLAVERVSPRLPRRAPQANFLRKVGESGVRGKESQRRGEKTYKETRYTTHLRRFEIPSQDSPRTCRNNGVGGCVTFAGKRLIVGGA